jgi:hypothetical protein
VEPYNSLFGIGIALKQQIADNKSRRDMKKKESESQRMKIEAGRDASTSSKTAGSKNKGKRK